MTMCESCRYFSAYDTVPNGMTTPAGRALAVSGSGYVGSLTVCSLLGWCGRYCVQVSKYTTACTAFVRKD